MKYTISEYNHWTTLSACVENHVFYEYKPSGLPYHRLHDTNENDGITMKLANQFMKELRCQMFGSYKK